MISQGWRSTSGLGCPRWLLRARYSSQDLSHRSWPARGWSFTIAANTNSKGYQATGDCLPLPERVFVIVVESESGRDPERMPLLRQTDQAGTRKAPAFSSMLLATTFLSQAQQLGYFVKLDYIFPADGRRLAEDFPEYRVQLDPSPQTFFREDPAS